MSLIRASEPSFMTADQAAQRKGYAARSELALRNKLESFCRERWPSARIVHELVMGEGRVRADVVALAPDYIAAFEVKGEYDETVRLLHQVGMYQLCVPEVWMVVGEKHSADARLIRHLLPCVGLIVGKGWHEHRLGTSAEPEIIFSEIMEPTPRDPVPEMMLQMLWRSELVGACHTSRVLSPSPKATRPFMIKALLELPEDEIMRLTCAQLRGRNAMWRADDPIALVPPRAVPAPSPLPPESVTGRGG
jgi:hypothetical protein